MTDLYIADMQRGITTLGPGPRIVMWTAGCTLGCASCVSPELFVRRPEWRRTVGETAKAIALIARGHTGVTISGGEPFQQARGLAALLREVRRSTDLDVLLYSGYTIEEIRCGPPAMQELLAAADMLIDGRYREDLPNTLVWRGSDNQRLHLLTNRAEIYHAYVDAPFGEIRPMHVAETADGGLRLIGIPRRGMAGTLSTRVAREGVALTKHTEAR